jgi:transcriptional regulator with XRE-family HTH domain
MPVQKSDPRKADNTDVEVGRLVRALRMSRGLSQTELADRMGVTFQQVQKYEAGSNRISMGRLTRVAKLFGVSVPYLLEGGKQAAVLKSSVRGKGEYSHALEMLGRIGAQRLLTAFAAVPAKPASLGESIVRVVENAAAAAAHGKGATVVRLALSGLCG